MLNPFDIPEDWLKAHSSPVNPVLEKIETDTNARFPEAAHMLSGFAQGRLLSLISKLKRPERILETGTFTGYSCLCLAEGLPESGRIITIEKSEEFAEIAAHWFRESGMDEKIRLLKGNAREILPTLDEKLDLVYLDADKAANREYLMAIWPRLNAGGLIIIDNVFARGGIMKPESDQRNFEKAVKKLNEQIPNQFSDATQFILPLRDGISILQKQSAIAT